MKNAIVTGGTKGIGLAIAKMLLKEEYFVTITYAHDDKAAETCQKELNKISKHFEVLKINQASKEDMKSFTLLMNEKPHIDCLILNTGSTLRKQLQDISDADWEEIMHINLNSNVYLIRDLFNKIPSHSRIIFIGSLMAIHPHGTSLAYGVTKSAIHALSKNLVKCFEGTGTTVNTIAPGFVETEWQKEKPQDIRNNIYNKTALKRFATVEEIADAVKFCINNSFINGSTIEVSGGYSYK